MQKNTSRTGFKTRLPIRFALIFILIAIALTTTVYYRAGVAMREELFTSFHTFTQFVSDSSPRPVFRQEWRTRLFSTYLSSKFVEHFWAKAISEAQQRESLFTELRKTQPYAKELYVAERGTFLPVALWVAFWFGLSLLCWGLFPRHSLLMMFGTFAGFMYGFITPCESFRMYAWDAPILFFFTAIVVAATRRSWIGLFFAVCIGVGFKETALAGSLCYLFYPGKIKKRLAWFTAALSCGVFIKLLIDIYTDNVLGLTMTHKDAEGVYLFRNIEVLFFLKPRIVNFCSQAWNTPWLANAGMVLAFWFLPSLCDSWMWRTVSLFITAGLLFCGVVTETRIFFELIPVALIQLARYLDSAFSSNIDAHQILSEQKTVL